MGENLPAVPDDCPFTHDQEEEVPEDEIYQPGTVYYGLNGKSARYQCLQTGPCPDPGRYWEFPQWVIWDGYGRQDKTYQAVRHLYFQGERKGFFHYADARTGEAFRLKTDEQYEFEQEVRASRDRVARRAQDKLDRECTAARAEWDFAEAQRKAAHDRRMADYEAALGEYRAWQAEQHRILLPSETRLTLGWMGMLAAPILFVASVPLALAAMAGMGWLLVRLHAHHRAVLASLSPSRPEPGRPTLAPPATTRPIMRGRPPMPDPAFADEKMFYSSVEEEEAWQRAENRRRAQEQHERIEAERRREEAEERRHREVMQAAERAHRTQVAAELATSALLADIDYNEHRQTRMMREERDYNRAARSNWNTPPSVSPPPPWMSASAPSAPSAPIQTPSAYTRWNALSNHEKNRRLLRGEAAPSMFDS